VLVLVAVVLFVGKVEEDALLDRVLTLTRSETAGFKVATLFCLACGDLRVDSALALEFDLEREREVAIVASGVAASAAVEVVVVMFVAVASEVDRGRCGGGGGMSVLVVAGRLR